MCVSSISQYKNSNYVFYMFYLFTGLSAELYYVRDGFVNEYALHFTVPVPANIRDISFTWQSLAGRPVNIIAFSLQ